MIREKGRMREGKGEREEVGCMDKVINSGVGVFTGNDTFH